MTRARRQSGFTLIEVMVAITIIALMMAIAYGTTQQTIKAKKHYEKVQERYREVRVAMNRMARDISMAYVSTNEDTSLMERRTFFVGQSAGDVDDLRFTSFAHEKLYRDANESDQTIISYYEAPDPDDRSQKDVFRRETKRLANAGESWETAPGQSDVLFAGVKQLKFEYWDVKDQEWDDSWNTTSADGKPNRVPDKVRITLTFEDERGKEVTFRTETRVHLQEALQFFTN